MLIRIVIFAWLIALLFYAPMEAPEVIDNGEYIQIEKKSHSLFYLIITDFMLYAVVFLQSLYIFFYSVKSKGEHFMTRYFSLGNVIVAFSVLFVYLIANIADGYITAPYDAIVAIVIALFASWIIYKKKLK